MLVYNMGWVELMRPYTWSVICVNPPETYRIARIHTGTAYVWLDGNVSLVLFKRKI